MLEEKINLLKRLSTLSLTSLVLSCNSGVTVVGGSVNEKDSGSIDNINDSGSEECVLDTTKEFYTGPNGTAGVGVCKEGEQTCSGNPAKWEVTTKEVTPSAEICDGGDNDCNGKPDNGLKFEEYSPDKDGDQYGDPIIKIMSCKPLDGFVTNNLDCNDDNSKINPEAKEECNNLDDDCNGKVDDGLTFEEYSPDKDGDKYGDSSVKIMSCNPIESFVLNNWDCNDNDVSINPGAKEVCNGIDDNCINGIDENLEKSVLCGYNGNGIQNQVCDNGIWVNEGNCQDLDKCVLNETKEFYTGFKETIDVGVCATGTQTCSGSPANWETTKKEVTPSAESCDGLDNNCNGKVDDGLEFKTYYADNDKDGYGNNNKQLSSCKPLDGHVTNNLDCDDNNPDINPFAKESCNGLDDNCIKGIDENLEKIVSCGYNEKGEQKQVCNNGVWINENNCQDSDECKLGATEEFYNGSKGTAGVGLCEVGTQTCSGNPAKWEVTTKEVTPSAESCDGLDNDCNGKVDDGLGFKTYYADSDKDSYGNNNKQLSSCKPLDGYVTNNLDCDDNNSKINPSAKENCNGLDDNCANGIDENLEKIVSCGYNGRGEQNQVCSNGAWINENNCQDSDECTLDATKKFYNGLKGTAGVGVCKEGEQTCSGNPAKWKVTKNEVTPSAEVCDGLDNDCDGKVDDELEFKTYYEDKDKDGNGNPNIKQESCTPVDGYVLKNLDCDDNNPDINPSAKESCNGLDDNCDNSIDEKLEGMIPCGYNGRGELYRYCSNGAWVNKGCMDLDECILDAIKKFYNGPKGTVGVGVCKEGEQTCLGNPAKWTVTKNEVTPSAEVCDTLDNNCDGNTDEENVCIPNCINDLVGYWSFDEKSGNIAHDSSGKGNDGIVYGAQWTTGKINGALNFAGNAYVEVPYSDSLDLGTESLTIGFWMNGTAKKQGIMHQFESDKGFLIQTDSINMDVIFTDGNIGTNIGIGSIAVNNWHYIAVTLNRDNQIGTSYFDGVPAISANISMLESLSNNSSLKIGHIRDTPSYYLGKLDEIKIRPCALSSEQIAEEFNKGN